MGILYFIDLITDDFFDRRVNLKMGVTRKQEDPNFPKKTNISYPPLIRTHTFVIRKIWRAFFNFEENQNFTQLRGVFKILSNVLDETFCKNTNPLMPGGTKKVTHT